MSVRSVGRFLRHPGPDRISAAIAVLWAIGVAVALRATLDSLRTEAFDGLNNLSQFPFGLPWVMLPLIGIFGWSYETSAWVDAGWGWLNAVLVLLYLPEWRRRHQRQSSPHVSG